MVCGEWRAQGVPLSVALGSRLRGKPEMHRGNDCAHRQYVQNRCVASFATTTYKKTGTDATIHARPRTPAAAETYGVSVKFFTASPVAAS